ncbi:transcriptional repressor LexA [Candidatus Pantoea carbekii]|uniref:LexA repressor n=1 Tax=Candidatus Pantoea carbekii TaxID=1235990 RepID=U3U5I6_9GAMM|nr:transcriptional repressor LexA [Candidatus Pantoea carbekii]AKC32378.1 LexA repressor LexA [Candidatus Pantoea carbekii]BAO00100.1 LexA protein [Candidatus Pantoea carbekii]
MKALTNRQQQVYEFIREYIHETGMPPTRVEIACKLGFRSPNSAEEHLKALTRKGVVKIVSGASRGIRLLIQGEKERGLPLIGQTDKGEPLLNQELIEARYQVDANLFKPAADFLLRIHGMSMKNIGIIDGDLLVVHKTQNVKNSQIVVVCIDNEVIVKRWIKKGSIVHLLPENPAFKPIIVDTRKRSLIVKGLAVGILRNNQTF